MRLKTLGVILIVATALFTMFYWVTDEPRRAAIDGEHEAELAHFGELVFSVDAAEPAAAGCAQCHGEDGRGGGPDAQVQGPNLHSAALAQKAEDYLLNTGLNYVETVIRHGGVAVSGNPNSLMPAWEQTLNRHQIDALVALIEGWIADGGEAPAGDTPDTAEAGEQIYQARCAACHQADLAGVPGQFPSLQNIGSVIGDDLPAPVAQMDQLLADYDEDPRAALEAWIRDSSGNYNDGQPTGMPAFNDVQLPDDQLRALITFLLEQTE